MKILSCKMLMIDNQLEEMGVKSDAWHDCVVDLDKVVAVVEASITETDQEFGTARIFTSSGMSFILDVSYKEFVQKHFNALQPA